MTTTTEILNRQISYDCKTCRNNINNKCSIRKAIECWWPKTYEYYQPKEDFLTERDVIL